MLPVSGLVVATVGDSELVWMQPTTGSVVRRVTVTPFETTHSVSADSDDNVYVGGSDVVSFDATGRERWRVRGSNANFVSEGPVVGQGSIYFGTPGGDVVALQAASGSELWRSKVDSPGAGVDNVVLVGGSLIVFAPGVARYAGLDASTGRELWRSPVVAGGGIDPIVAGGVIVTNQIDYVPASSTFIAEGWALDGCGGRVQRLNLGVAGGFLTLTDVDLVGTRGEEYTQQHLLRLDTTTGSVREDVAVGQPSGRMDAIALGADGRLYVQECRIPAVGERSSWLHVYTDSPSGFVEESVVDLAPGCTRRDGAALTAAGMLYLSSGRSIVAVQTKSPGLAPTHWPLHDVDNQASRRVPTQ